MSVVVAAEVILAVAALTDQLITITDRLKRVPYMSREELIVLLREAGVDTDKLISEAKADLEKLRLELKGGS